MTSASALVEKKLAVDDLLNRYALCIDEDRLDEWPEFFVENCLYRITHINDFNDGHENAIIYADSRGMLEDRVNAVRNVSVYEAHRYRHIIGAAMIEAGEGDEVFSAASFIVIRIEQDGESSVFASGVYRDRIDFSKDKPLFREKVVVMDSQRVDTLLAIPL